MYLHADMANTPTSASFMQLSPSMGLRYGFKRSNLKQKLSKVATPRLPSSSVELVQPVATLSYLDPSKAKRKRLSVNYSSSAVVWDAHDDPVYGYTNGAFDYRSEVQQVRDVAMSSYKEGTTRAEIGHLKYWNNFCAMRGLRHWRDDHEANSGRNIAGYQREVDILASFALDTAKIMPGRRGRQAGLPSSVANVVRGVRRAHEKLIPPVHMVPMKAVNTTLNGINQRYLEEYGYQKMIPRRAEPYHRQHLAKLFKLQTAVGTAFGSFVVSTTLFWVSWFALLATLAQSGCRKSEVAVLSACDWNGNTHVSRASLRWFIGGVAVNDPTVEQLRSLTESDYALIIPPPSKTDRFGIVWGDKPMYFPVRYSAPYCAALQLRALELAYPLHGKHRVQAPLFVQEPGIPFTFYILTKLLASVKPLIMPEVEDTSAYTYHSFRVLLATQLGSSRCSTQEIQSMCRWLSPASVALYNRLQPLDAIAMLDQAQSATISSTASANLPPFKHTHVSDAIAVGD